MKWAGVGTFEHSNINSRRKAVSTSAGQQREISLLV